MTMINIKSELAKIATRFNPESGSFEPLSVQPRVGAWSLNETGYDLRQGYLVAITGYDATKRLFSIARPDSNGVKNVAVVKSEFVAAGDGHLVELVLLGENQMAYCRDTATNDMLDLRLWWGGTSPSGHAGDEMSSCPAVGGLVGTLAESFECTACAGGPFMVLGDGATAADTASSVKRVKVGFAGSGGGTIHLVQVTSVNSSAHTVKTRNIILKADLAQTPNYTTDSAEAEVTYAYLAK